jgi:heme/copper-type cytochrome/quinol oxidase subunit 3
MIRPIATEVALFAAPFLAYAIFLVATRTRVLDPEAWSWRVLGWLTISAFVLMIGSFIVFAHYSGDAPGSTYIPAHMEDGKFVPAETR